MKRSEIIKLIVKHGHRVSEHPSFNMEHWANRLLDVLEQEGMNPPKIRERVVPNTEPSFPYSQTVNKWEKE